MNKIQVATGVSRNFLEPLIVMGTSLAVNNKNNKIVFNIFHEDFTNEDIEKVREKLERYQGLELKFFFVTKKMVEGLPLAQHFRLATYFRVLSPMILEDLDKLLYLDTDMIIDGDIRELWEIDIDNFILAAVREEAVGELEKRLNLPVNYKYFNAGTVLLNLKKIREKKIFEKVLEYLKDNSNEMLYLDQDALNALIYQDWLEIDEKWNYHNTFVLKRLEKLKNVLIDEPIIIHYTGPLKPWHSESKHVLKYLYLKYENIAFNNKNMNSNSDKQSEIKVKRLKRSIKENMKKVYRKLKHNKLAIELYKKIIKIKFIKNKILELKSNNSFAIQVMKSFSAKKIDKKNSILESLMDVILTNFREYSDYILVEGYAFKKDFSDRNTKKYIVFKNKKNNEKYTFVLNDVDITDLNYIYNDGKDYSKSGFFNFINKKELKEGSYEIGILIEKNDQNHYKTIDVSYDYL